MEEKKKTEKSVLAYFARLELTRLPSAHLKPWSVFSFSIFEECKPKFFGKCSFSRCSFARKESAILGGFSSFDVICFSAGIYFCEYLTC